MQTRKSLKAGRASGTLKMMAMFICVVCATQELFCCGTG